MPNNPASLIGSIEVTVECPHCAHICLTLVDITEESITFVCRFCLVQMTSNEIFGAEEAAPQGTPRVPGKSDGQ